MLTFMRLWKSSALAALLLVVPMSAAVAGTWQVTTSPTNSHSSSASSTDAISVAFSSNTSASLLTTAGVTSAEVTGSAQAAYSGTWTFTWVPDNSSDWPSSYTITSAKTRTYESFYSGGTGTALTKPTGGSNLTTATSTTTGTTIVSSPSISTTTDTSVAHLTVTTKTVSDHYADNSNGGWEDTITSLVSVTRQYDASYFTSNFAAPNLIVLTFTVDSVDLTASIDFTSSSSTALMQSLVSASEVYSGN